ncbi:mechanosensitive ion channel family protein [Solidesulfovibrio sp.]|uniref:mechanosensitive ion channel family protein n=1 Tax=Solidesulfovibrio sp. TaxID=2910990 RepID=UPI002B1F1415|nr:mechanosensitive ion channel domain-containing protein [Solidesulfovibrio sp.]MEA4856537.1 mechanosensitive ion channel [Solidesulfovibrio sp.]
MYRFLLALLAGAWLCLAAPALAADPDAPAKPADGKPAVAAPAPDKPKPAPDKPAEAKPAADRPAAPEAEQPKDWQVLLSIHQESLVQQAARFKSMEGLLPKNVRRFRSDLSNLEGKLDELNLILSLSGGNPWEMRAVLSDMGRLRRAADSLMAPFADSREELEKIAAKLASLKEDFTKRLDDDLEAPIAEAINYYLRYIKGVAASLGSVRAALDKELGPAKDFLDALSASEEALKKRIPLAWKQYYFTPTSELFSVKAWSALPNQAQLWLHSNGSMAASVIQGTDRQRALSSCVRLGVGLLLLAVADAVAMLRLRKRVTDRALLGRLRRVWWLAGLSLAAHWVSGDAPLLMQEILNALSEILLAAALASFSWALARPEGEGRGPANPLRPLWLLFSLGLLLQIADLPEPAMASAWIALLAGFLALSRRGAARGAGPVAFLAGRAGTPLAVGLCLVAALGWQHLSFLILTGWFLVLAALQTGLGLSRRLAAWQEAHAGDDGASFARRALVDSLGYPLLYLSLFFLVLYWLSAELGGQDMFVEAVSFTVTLGGLNLTLGRLALILTGFFATRSLLFFVRSFLRGLPQRSPGIDPGVCDVLETTSLYLLWGIYTLISLFLLGFSFTSLAVVAGGLSVGIGFGLQNIVNNFIAGLILLFGRSIQAGDTIQIDATWGKVAKVNIRNTVVRTFQNATLFVPNSDLISGKLINWTHRDPTMRRDITVGVAYGTDTDTVRDILIEVAKAQPHVLRNPEPVVQFSAFGDSSLDFLLMVWVDNVAYGASTESDIRFAINRRFREQGIEIPFPQREVRIVAGADTPAAMVAAAAAGADD